MSVQPVSYLNVQITEANGGLVAQRDISRSGSVLDMPADYYVGVERCMIPMGQLPLWCPVLEPGIEDGLTIVDKMSLKYGGSSYETNLKLIKLPTAVIPGGPGVSRPERYTWVFDRETVALMKTNALVTLAAAAGLTAASAPYIAYNPVTQLETLYAYPMSVFNLGTNFENLATAAVLGFNSLSITLWRGWSATYNKELPANSPYAWMLNIVNDGTNYVGAPQANGDFDPPDPATTLMTYSQSWPNAEMVEISSIEIHSTLPSLPEYTDGVPINTNTQNTNAPILTDLYPDFSQDPNGYQTISIYNAAGLGGTRWIKLTGRSPITTFSISLWWVDRSGVRRPLPILYQRCSVKLAFAHRSIVENYKI